MPSSHQSGLLTPGARGKTGQSEMRGHRWKADGEHTYSLGHERSSTIRYCAYGSSEPGDIHASPEAFRCNSEVSYEGRASIPQW